MSVATYLHGTYDEADDILREGFSLEAPRRNDPGDMGWGVYLTNHNGRARAHGQRVLMVSVETRSFAEIKNPYFLDGLTPIGPVTDAERIFHAVAFDCRGEMRTIHAADRVAAARRVRGVMIAAGYGGIIAGPDKRGQTEVVVFNLSCITEVSEVRGEGSQRGYATILDNRDGSFETVTANADTVPNARARAFFWACDECDKRNQDEPDQRFVPLSWHSTRHVGLKKIPPECK